MGETRLSRLALAGALGAVGFLMAAPAASGSAPHTYYVSATGDDSLDGTSPATAWRTLQPVNSRALAGDTVLLQGGASFTGPLSLDSRDTGATIASFGTGHARILGAGTSAVVGYDVAGVTVKNLDLAGDAAAYGSKGGLSFYSDLPAGQRLTGISISDVTAQGFKNGVEIGGAHPGAGFAQVSIADVRAVANRDAGIITYGPVFDPSAPSYANAGVNVVHSTANGNLGNPANTTGNSGNGIVLGSVDGGSILHSTASGNGLRCTAPEGPAGIWTYDSRSIRIAYDTATGNRTGGNADGDGFDLDQNVSHSSLEDNISSGNDGAGYLVYAGPTSATDDNVVVGNTSQNDAAKNSWYGGITLAGNVHLVTVTHNSVDTRKSASHPPALAIRAGVTQAKVAANHLRSAAGHQAVVGPR